MTKLIIVAALIIFSVKVINLTNTDYNNSSNILQDTQLPIASEVKIIPTQTKLHEKPKVTPKPKPIKVKKQTFKCDKRKYCSQMRSYDEAKYFLRHCRGVKMDGDHDGIPCERQFRKYY